MNKNSQAILEAALRLPDHERESIAEKLLASLRLTTDDLSDDELVEELARRKAEHERDPNVAKPWTDVKDLR